MSSSDALKWLNENFNFVDSVTIIDHSGTIIAKQRFNPRYTDEENAADNQWALGKNLLEVFPGQNFQSSALLAALKTDGVIYRQQEIAWNHLGKKSVTNNLTIPIVCRGQFVGSVQLSRDVTNMGRSGRTVQRAREESSAPAATGARYTLEDIVGQSPEIQEVRRLIQRIANSSSSVLVYGETGTGKELVVSSIHNASYRKDKTFMPINCAALPESLLESELFGYERGAFTGARQSGKKGLFEQANGGTIFLDEIGDMPLALQSRLLRVLQEKQVMRVGADSIIDIDVRVIAATNQNLMAKMEEGIFRSDLYYRLNVLPCHIASLRDRREDIVPLFLSFIGQKSIPNDLAARLKSYDWPGNVRELENTAEYYTMMRDFDMPLPEHIQPQHTAAGVLDSDDIAILSVLSNGYIGRSALKKKLEAIGISLSEYSIRKKLDVLQSRNYISRQLGRSGTRITDDGRDALQRRMGK